MKEPLLKLYTMFRTPLTASPCDCYFLKLVCPKNNWHGQHPDKSGQVVCDNRAVQKGQLVYPGGQLVVQKGQVVASFPRQSKIYVRK